jgi:Methyltransferase domain
MWRIGLLAGNSQMSFQRLAQALLHGRPYFGQALRALQGNPARHRYFEPAVRRRSTLQDGPIKILEIGSWAAASAVTWARALRAVGRPGGVTCIDTWRPYFEAGIEDGAHYRDMTEAAETGDVYRLFLHNLKACGVDSMVTHRIADSRDLTTIFTPGSFDIVYIDGSHLLPFVRSDISAAIDLAGPTGMICGDDLELQHHEVDATDHAAATASMVDYAFSTRAQQHYHPGVTEGVAEAFGLAANHEGFWAVERQGASWTPALLDCADAELPTHIRDALDECTTLVAEVGLFNIMGSADRFVAISRTLGPVDVFTERLGDRDLEPIVLVGSSLDEVCRKVAAVTPLGAAEPNQDHRLSELTARIDTEFGAAVAVRAEQDRRLGELSAWIDTEFTRLRTASAVADVAKAKQDLQLAELTARINIEFGAAVAAKAEQDHRLAELTERMAAQETASPAGLSQARADFMAAIDATNAGQNLRLSELAGRVDANAARIDSATDSVDCASLRIAELRRLLATLTQEAIEAEQRLRRLEHPARSALPRWLRANTRHD